MNRSSMATGFRWSRGSARFASTVGAAEALTAIPSPAILGVAARTGDRQQLSAGARAGFELDRRLAPSANYESAERMRKRRVSVLASVFCVALLCGERPRAPRRLAWQDARRRRERRASGYLPQARSCGGLSCSWAWRSPLRRL